jgi:hypothetical protein
MGRRTSNVLGYRRGACVFAGRVIPSPAQLCAQLTSAGNEERHTATADQWNLVIVDAPGLSPSSAAGG